MRDKSLVVSVLISSLLALSLAACGGDDDGASTTPDAAGVSTPDAAVNNLPDASTPGGCTSPATLTLDAANPNSGVFLVPAAGTSAERYVYKYLTGDVGSQFLQLSVNTPVQVGTSLDLATGCTQTAKYCLVVVGNYQVDQTTHMVSGDLYFATAGTLTVTEAGAVNGNFKADLAGVQLTHIEGSAPAADGCKTAIPDTSLDLVVQAPMKRAQPGTSPALPWLGATAPALQ